MDSPSRWGRDARTTEQERAAADFQHASALAAPRVVYDVDPAAAHTETQSDG